jgi:hypothetical protein
MSTTRTSTTHILISLDPILSFPFPRRYKPAEQPVQHHLTNTRLIYQIVKARTNYWKANTLWKMYDKLRDRKEYKRSAGSRDLSVLIIGGGPVGLRASIEMALLGFR